MTPLARNWLIGIIVLIIIVVGIWSYQANQNNSSNVTGEQSNLGRAVIAVTDAPATLQNVQSVTVTINQVELQGANQGWITVSETPKQVDLMQLKQASAMTLLADVNLPPDTYNKIRLNISQALVQVAGQAAKEAKLPSNKMELVGKLVVSADQTSTLVVDFELDKSLHVTGNGQYILTPVIKLTTQSATNVSVDANNQVKINSGTAEDSQTSGMDVDGTVKSNFAFDGEVELIDNTIHASSAAQSETGIKIAAKKAIDLAKASGKIDTALSIKLITQNNKKAWQITGLLNLLPVQVLIDATTGTVVTS